jgi:hypothetical protein
MDKERNGLGDPAMATDGAKDVALRSIEFVRNRANIQALEEATTPDFVDDLEVIPDATAMRCGRFWSRPDRPAFPGWRVEIEDVAAQGETVAVRWKGQLRHQGAFHRIPTRRHPTPTSNITARLIPSDPSWPEPLTPGALG